MADGGMTKAVAELIGQLKEAIKFVELRGSHETSSYFEGVLLQSDLPACRQVLQQTLGTPLKDFNQTVTFETQIQWAVSLVGGIRMDQCLFFAKGEGRQVGYAALWPWASDATRVTVKVGLLDLK